MPQRSLLRLLVQPLALAIGLAALARLLVHFYTIPSASMEPTLLPGDQVLVMPYRLGATPSTGHVVVLRSPADGTLLVKRVIATAGELVDSHIGRLRVGGYSMSEPYVSHPAATGSIQAQVIPPGSYFVLGDNRTASLDSRAWGPVPRHLIVGRAHLIVWHSPHREDGGVSRKHRVFKWVR